MGKSISRLVSDYVPESISDAYYRLGNKRKRSYPSDDDESNLEESLYSPKKRKLVCTTQYIYKALFIDGRNHDVVVDALGKEWKLHKVYLTQSPYFQSMFSGSWKETNNKYIRIEVTDPNINVDSLRIVLGSLYLDEVSIEPVNVVGILAAATLFQLDGLIEQCLSVMVESISPLTAVAYSEAATQYGLQRIKHATVKWFLANLMTYYPSHPQRLKYIESDLMSQLVQHQELVVVQTEFCLYKLLKFWVFLKLHPRVCESEQDSKPCAVEVDDFFHNRPDSSVFLLSPEGGEYLRAFRGLRLGSLLTQEQDLATLAQDRILPEAWLYPVLNRQWASLLRVDRGSDHGPDDKLVSQDQFLSACVRCGRVLEGPETNTWKWTVFNYGLDLVWSTFNGVVTVRRAGDDSALTDLRPRQVMLRVTISTLDKQRQVRLTQSSGVMKVLLVRNIESKIMDLCPDFEHPLIVSVNLLSVTPANAKPKPQS